MAKFDLGIRCDFLITMAGGIAQVQNDYFIGIHGESISVVAPFKSQRWSAKKNIYRRGHVVMPGLINGHTHLAMSLFKGLADDLPFHEWLYDYILPLEAKLVDGAFVKTGTELAALESISSGVTTVCDMYFFGDVVAEVLDRAGMRALVSEAITDFPTPDDKKHTGVGYKIIEKMIKKYKKSSRITPCAGPHAPYTCGDETLTRVREFAKAQNIPIVIHVSETKKEVSDSLEKYLKSPVKRLFDLGLMKKGTVFAHCVHLDEADMRLMAQTETGAIYNPESNMKLGAGVAPIPKFLKMGMKVGIGTDGSASNNDLNLFREMDTGAKLQKLHNFDNTALTAGQALSLATWGGARALGLGDKVGSLEVGKFADLITVDMNHDYLQPIHDLVSQLVYSAAGTEVDTVICSGRVIMENRKIKTLNSKKIVISAQKFRDKIQASLKK